ncbi:MAG TPA: pitrilysin family protein, partial [Thermoleophilaceae bacterium]|nr:pitrilysin family protein [Thermoleophilaceae bacterium]
VAEAVTATGAVATATAAAAGRTTRATGASTARLTGDGHTLTQLDSGVRVVTEAMPSVRSIALGFWVRVGSRDESSEQAGISHFLEHLLFKGTDRFTSVEIDQIFDGMGAEANAGTGKETTSVYSRFLDQHLERAFDVLADMVLRPSYPDIDSERQVVIEEIAMYEDEPSDKVHDVLSAAIFGDHPLGRPIIGRADVVSSVPVPEIAAYHDSRYVGPRLVVAAAGNIEHEKLVDLVSAACADASNGGNGGGGAPAPVVSSPRASFHEKSTEQYHLCLGGPGIPRGDDRRFALRVLDTLFGGSSSSRLFQEVREKRGLAYSVYSYASHYVDTGQVGLYVGTRPDNVSEALGIIGDELERIVEQPVSADELTRAKENVKGRMVLSFESTLTHMNRLGGSVLMDVPLLSLDEMLAAIDGVTADDVAELARELFVPDRLSAAGVGADEDVFRRALEPVSPALAA